MLVILRSFLLRIHQLFSCEPLRFNRQQIVKLSHFIDLFLLVMGPKDNAERFGRRGQDSNCNRIEAG